jgi:diamine N-acetyltransferase
MIDAGHRDHHGRAITLGPVGDDWRAVADVVPRDDQRDHVPPMAARYLLLSMLESDWTSLAIRADDLVVGHVMWGVDDDGSRWIGGLVVDAAEQGRGVGRAAMVSLMDWLHDQPDATAVRLAHHPTNASATHLYETLGFTPTGDMDGDEVVVEHRRPAPR